MSAAAPADGILGPLCTDTLLMVFDHLDLPDLLVANNVCRAWRSILAPRWKRAYSSIEGMDRAVLMRLEDLDAAADAASADKDAPITEAASGDLASRGVSGPPIDPVLMCRLALKSGWRTVFRANVVDELPADSTILKGIRDAEAMEKRGAGTVTSMEDTDDEDGNDEESPVPWTLRLPPTLGLTYDYGAGSRRPRPDWRKLCHTYATTQQNLRNANVVKTTIVPLYIPSTWIFLSMSDDDVADNTLLFTAFEKREDRSWRYILITVERTTGEIRHVTELPPPREVPDNFRRGGAIERFSQSVAACEGIGMCYNINNDSDLWDTYISGRAFESLCPGVGVGREETISDPKPYLRYVDEFGTSFHNLDFGIAPGRHGQTSLLVAQLNYRWLSWKNWAPSDKESAEDDDSTDDDDNDHDYDWDHEADDQRECNRGLRIKKSWNAGHVQLNDKYVFLGYRESPGGSQIRLYDMATKELFVSIPAGVQHVESMRDETAALAVLAFRVRPEITKRRRSQDADWEDDLAIREFSLRGNTPDQDAYWQMVKENVWTSTALNGQNTVEFQGWHLCGKHMSIAIQSGGFLFIMDIERVLAEAAELPTAERARYISKHTILIDPGKNKLMPYSVSRDHLVLDVIKMDRTYEEGYTSTIILDLSSLPPLSPGMCTKDVRITGHALLRREYRKVSLVELHMMGGYLFEVLKYPWDEDANTKGIFLDEEMVGKVALRMTSYVPSA